MDNCDDDDDDDVLPHTPFFVFVFLPSSFSLFSSCHPFIAKHKHNTKKAQTDKNKKESTNKQTNKQTSGNPIPSL
jgi:hypothetical protein